MNWAALKKGVGHALFPERCLFCAKPVPCGTLFCSSCACEDHQPYVEAGRCAFCGSAYGDCTCGLTTVSVYYYEEGAQQAVHRMKFEGERLCAEQLAVLMAGRYRESGLMRPDLIVPVPLHPWDCYRRGFSQTDWLCRALSAQLSVPWEKKALRKIRRTKKQHALPKEERRGNLAGAFCAPSPKMLAGKCVLLVDDVFTTGATLKESALALKQAGARRVLCLTAAKTRFTGTGKL